MPISLIDILFLFTALLFIFNGIRNGAIFSLIHTIGIPLGFFIVYLFGARFTNILDANGLPATPLIAYLALFLGTVLIIHIVGTILHTMLKTFPMVNIRDAILGGGVGFIEAWLLWLFLLIILGNFLADAQNTVHQGAHLIPGFNIQVDHLRAWHDFYNETTANSFFAKANSFLLEKLPTTP